MPYMGIQELKDANIKSGSATGDGSTTTFAIGWTPPSEQSLFVTINGVLQSDAALSISGSNCVFTAAPASADAIEFKGIQSGGTVTTLGDGVVNAAQLGSNSVVTASVADNNITTAKILDNNVTVAKIAGSAAAAAGTYLQQNGTWSEVATGTTWQAVKTADFTAVAGEGYPCNTTSGGIVATLPVGSAGDTIEFFDYAGTFDTNVLRITPGGSDKIKGGTSSQEMDKERSGASLTFFDATQGWISTSGINEGTSAMAIPTYNSETLITGGGGSGTDAIYNGGGGAGGLLYYGAETPKTPNGVALILQLGSVYTVTIGAGGSGTPTGGTNGSDTVFSGTGITTQTAVGGGKGDASSGGSGGGRGHGGGAGGAGTANQGNSGGSGVYCGPGYPSGGGGGAGGAGAASSGCGTPGAGGAGLNYSITGSSVNYAAGGGAGTWQAATAAAGGDSAGAGNVAAPDGRGGGGGADKDGGDGCVILRMLTTDYSGTTSGSPTVTTDGSYTIINYVASGTYTA